jgi:arylsulfatase
MSDDQDNLNRSVLPIPARPRTGLITYDAKDPETKYPKIEQLRPPKGAPNVLVILIDDAGFGSSSAFGGPCQTPNVQPFPYDGSLLADTPGAAYRPQSPFGWHGWHHRDC